MSYILKEKAEDFIVEEIPIYFLGKGAYSIIKVVKKEMNTENAARIIAQALDIPRKSVGYAGAKDRNAKTSQFMSVKNASKEKINAFSHEKIAIAYVTTHNNPLSLGDLDGNIFTITVRGIDTGIESCTHTVQNLFGIQRFGKNNAVVGKLILQKKFAEAAQLIEDTNVQEALKKKPKDPISAIKELPRHTQLLYVHAYQSYLWNTVVGKLGHYTRKVPVLGFGTELDDYLSIIEELYQTLMQEEGITQKDFVIKQLPGISPEGDERVAQVIVEIVAEEIKDDELHNGKKKQVVSFSLPKGSYATIVIDSLFT